MAFAFMFGIAVSFVLLDWYIGDAIMEWNEIKEWCEIIQSPKTNE